MVCPCEPKVGEFKGSRAVEEDVGAFYVAVQDASMMEVVETFQHLAEQVFYVGGFEGKIWVA